MSEADKAFTGSIAETYDRYMGPMLFEPFAAELAGRFAGFEGAILETAAGTGRLTRALAQSAPAATIMATDLNEPMLAYGAGVVDAPNVAWQQADAQSLPFQAASFDAVVCQFGVMFLPNKVAGFAEARRVLKPGGRYVFSVWGPIEANELTTVAQRALEALLPDDPPGFYARVPFAFHDPGEIRLWLQAAGFGDVKAETVTLDTGSPSALAAATGLVMGSPVRTEIEGRHPGRLDDAVRAAARALTKRFGAGEVVGRGQALVVTASA
jgi:SAM-dependent methyltransferase